MLREAFDLGNKFHTCAEICFETESVNIVPEKGALCVTLFFSLFPFQLYSSLEKGQPYIFRVGSGQVNS